MECERLGASIPVTTSENENGHMVNLTPLKESTAQHVDSPETTTTVAPSQGDPPQPQLLNVNNDANLQRPADSILTMEPASHSDQRNFRTTQSQNRTRQRRLRQAMLTHANRTNQNLPNYPKYFSVKLLGTDLDKANPIAIERSLLAEAGNFAANVRRQNRNTLLVQASNQQQANKPPHIKKIASYEVVITAHSTLNQSKGTVFSETLSACTIEELEEVLRDQGVTKVERMKRRVNGALVDTHRHIFTFNKPAPPQTIRVTDWHYELVDLYIPTPMQCIKCQKLGHTQKHCRRGTNVCARCAQEGHQARDCQSDPRCANCDGAHRSMDKKCPHYEYKAEILATQTRRRCTYHEAVDQVQDQFRTQGRRYNFMARRQNQQRLPTVAPAGSSRLPVAPQGAGPSPAALSQAEVPNSSQRTPLPANNPSSSIASVANQTQAPPPTSAAIASSTPTSPAAKPKRDFIKPKSRNKKPAAESRTRSSSVVDYSSDSSEGSSALENQEKEKPGDEWTVAHNRSRPRKPRTSQSQTTSQNSFSILASDDEADISDALISRTRRQLSPEEDSCKKPAKLQQLTAPLEKSSGDPQTESPEFEGAAAAATEVPTAGPSTNNTRQTLPAGEGLNNNINSLKDLPAPMQDQEQDEASATPYKATLIGSLASKKGGPGRGSSMIPIPTLVTTDIDRGRDRTRGPAGQNGRGQGNSRPPPSHNRRGGGPGRSLSRHNR